MGYWNINGLVSNKVSLKQHFRENEYDVFAVGEAKVANRTTAPRFEGFKDPLVLSGKTNAKDTASRGTVVYVREGITSEIIERSSNYNRSKIEVFLLKITKRTDNGQHTMKILFIYKPPSAKKLDNVIEHIYENYLKSCAFLILGDFNLDLLWQQPEYNPLPDRVEFMMDYSTITNQAVRGKSSSVSLIDHIWGSKRVVGNYHTLAGSVANTPGWLNYHYIIWIALTRKPKAKNDRSSIKGGIQPTSNASCSSSSDSESTSITSHQSMSSNLSDDSESTSSESHQSMSSSYMSGGGSVNFLDSSESSSDGERFAVACKEYLLSRKRKKCKKRLISTVKKRALM